MSGGKGMPSAVSQPERHAGPADFFVRLWREKPLGIVSGIVVLMLIVVAIFADVLAPYPYWEVHQLDRIQGASARYLLGTDQLGRDLLSRLIYGARLSLVVGLAATVLNVAVAVLLGGTSGFLGGKFDLVAQRFVLMPSGVIDHNVHSGPGSVTDNTGPGDIRRNRRLENNEKRCYWCKGERLFSDGRGDWQYKMESTHSTCPAQYCASGNHHIQHQHRCGDYD